MALDFSNPPALLALLPAAAIAVFIYHKYGGKSFHGGTWSLLLRLLVILLLVFSLAGPVIRIPMDYTEILFVADLSDSTISKQEEMAAFISDSLKLLPENYHAGIVTFGGNALIEQSVGSSRNFHAFHSKPDRDYSNIDKALQRAGGLFAQDSGKRIVLLTDGAENMGDALLRAAALGQRGIPVDVLHLDTAPPREVQLSELAIPAALYKGENYDVRVEINSTVETRGILYLYANRTPAGKQEIQIQKGKIPFCSARLPATGTVVYEAELEPLPSDDTFRQNNRMASYARIEGPPVIALVEGQEEEGREIAKIMEAGGLEYRLLTPHTLPNQLEELVKYDAIILANVDYDALGREKTELLDYYVKSMGRGLLVTGGSNSYALGGYLGTRLEEILPVDMDLSKKKEMPSLALVTVIDKSSSMSDTQSGVNKMELAKKQPSLDRGAGGQRLYRGAQLRCAASRVAEIQKRQTGGNTEAIGQPTRWHKPYPGLKQLPVLQNADTALKHVIVLTDGHTRL